MESRKKSFRELIKKKKLIDSNLALLHWDMETVAPKGGQELLAELIGDLSLKSYEITTSKEFRELLSFLNKNRDNLTIIERKEIDDLIEEIEKIEKIPPHEYREFSELTASAQNIWAEAREKNDFSMFQESLEKIFELSKKFADYRKKDGENLYDIILSDYEKGMDIEKLDIFFQTLKSEIVPLLRKISEKNIDYSKALVGSVPRENQKDFSKFICDYLGFDFNRGAIGESAHPFTLTVNTDDVRLTTRYIENLPLSSIFSTIHESGHGIYEQGIASALKETTLADGTSMGIHESQSRFYENIVGRSEKFWESLFPKLQESYQYLKNISFSDFYKGINSVQPSFIRVEADELTYSLHIMVRYEIEKGIFRGEYQIKDLSKIWNDKMMEYLGIVPDSDSNGVLQDVHWSCGLIGYFPSYALGNAYSLQIFHAMKRDLDVDTILKNGELKKLREWLQKKIHTHGKCKTPEEIILEVTGETLNPKYYTDYLKDKYSKIYNI